MNLIKVQDVMATFLWMPRAGLIQNGTGKVRDACSSDGTVGPGQHEVRAEKT